MKFNKQSIIDLQTKINSKSSQPETEYRHSANARKDAVVLDADKRNGGEAVEHRTA